MKKFLIVSYISSRHGRPSWWSDEDQKNSTKFNTEILPDYFKAKVAADEHLLALAHKRSSQGDSIFQAINLRPGALTDDPATGRVTLGKTGVQGSVPRADVAAVAAALLDRNDTRGWYDLLEGDAPIDQAVEALVQTSHDGTEGEDLERIYAGTPA